MKRKSYRRKSTKGKGSFNKKVLAVIKRTAEPKRVHMNMNMSQFNGPTELYHNSFNQWKIFDMSSNVVMFPNEGVQKYERNGDEIYGKGFMIRGSFGFAGDRRGTTLRFYLVKPKNVNSMSLVVTAYDHNSALQTDICIKEIDLMCSFYYSDP